MYQDDGGGGTASASTGRGAPWAFTGLASVELEGLHEEECDGVTEQLLTH